MKVEVREVTPEMAKEMLKRNNGNRNSKESHINFLSNQMKLGKWMFDGQPIRFSDGGNLLDGQHRLNAVVESGTTQEFLIVIGVKSDSFKVMDTGLNRSAGDCLHIEGIDYSNTVAAAIKFTIGLNNSRVTGTTKLSNSEIIEWYNDNKSILDLVKKSEDLAKSFSRVLSTSQIAAYWFFFSQRNVSAAEVFIRKLCNGVDLSQDGSIYVLRKKLIDVKLGSYEINRHIKSALIIKAWNIYRKGETCKVLRWSKDVEKFPTAI